jgi:hypothetical protein
MDAAVGWLVVGELHLFVLPFVWIKVFGMVDCKGIRDKCQCWGYLVVLIRFFKVGVIPPLKIIFKITKEIFGNVGDCL